MIVISEDRISTERSRNPSQTLGDELGAFRAEGYEVTAKQEEVGRLRFQGPDGIGQDLAGGYRTDVEIGGEGDSKNAVCAECLAQGDLVPLHAYVG